MPQPQMPASAQATAGMAWLLKSPKTISNRTHPKHPKGLGKVRVFSVRERKNERRDMAAVALRRDDLLSKMLQQSSQTTCPSSNSLSNPILLKAKSFLPKSLSDAPK